MHSWLVGCSQVVGKSWRSCVSVWDFPATHIAPCVCVCLTVLSFTRLLTGLSSSLSTLNSLFSDLLGVFLFASSTPPTNTTTSLFSGYIN